MSQERKRRGVAVVGFVGGCCCLVRVTTEVFCYACKVVEMFFKYPHLDFICGLPPTEVDFVYVGFSHERAGCEDCRTQSHLVILCCGNVKALFLGFH